MKFITTTHQRQIENARERMIRDLARQRIQDEVIAAKQIQQETGCTWTDALRTAYQLCRSAA